jgi:hypothetical protein
VEAGPDVATAIDAWRAFVSGETLATNLELGTVPADMFSAEDEIDGQPIKIGLRIA